MFTIPSSLPRKPGPGARVNRAHPLARGLVACWLCTEGGGTRLVDACGIYHGAIGLTGGISWGPGRLGRPALVSAATAGSVVVNGMGMPALTRYTLEAWLVSQGSDSYGTVCVQNTGLGWFMRNTGGGDKLNFYTGADHLSTATLTAGTLYHVVVTSRGTGAMDYYLNGVLDSSQSFTVPSFTANILLNDGASETFIGTLDLLRIYDHDMTAAEVRCLYQSPFAMLTSRASLWWVGGMVSNLPITPDPSILTLQTVNPTVVLGSVTITPSPATWTLDTINPSVILGAVTITPAPSLLTLGTVDPSIPAPLVITPAAASLALSTVNPTVLMPLIVTTAPATLRLETRNPQFALPLTMTPPAVTLRLSTGNPTVTGPVTVAPAPAMLTLETAGPLPIQQEFLPIASPVLVGLDELVLLSHYTIQRRMIAPQRVLSLGNGAQSVRRLGERPTYEFVLQDRQRVQADAEALYSFAQYHQGHTPFWFSGYKWGTVSTPILFGEGDGETRTFLLNNRHILEDSLTVYMDDLAIDILSVDWEGGAVRTVYAPDVGTALTATYQCRYLCVFATQGDVLLNEAYFYNQLLSYEGIVLREYLVYDAGTENNEQWEYSPPGWDDLVLAASEDWES